MAEDNFTCKIHQHIAVLSRNAKSGWCKELNQVSYNGSKPKYDIREWDANHQRMSKGITLSDSEMDIIRGLFEHGRL